MAGSFRNLKWPPRLRDSTSDAGSWCLWGDRSSGEKKEFLRHIQPAIKTLIEVASLAENFSFFAEFLTCLPDRPKPRI